MLGIHKSISLPQSTEYAKEMARHEALPTQWGPPGRPYEYREYPRMLYKFDHVPGRGFDKVDMRIAGDEDEQRNLESRGFHPTQELAYAAAEKAHTEAGALAAEREWEIRNGRLSPRAAAEVRAAEAEHGARHLPEVPAKPVRRRARKTF